MIFEKIEITNFFRIRETVTIPLADQGLVLITGENGHGKSTIFEALVWCLEGITVRGYRSDQVVNRDVGKDCSVSLYMSEGFHSELSYRLTRYRKHKTGKNKLEFISYDHGTGVETDLTQQTNDDTQAKVREVMGIDYDTFTNGPMMPQGSFKRFSEMSDAEIKSILEKAVQIAVIAKAQAQAKTAIARVDLELAGFETRFDQLGNTLDGLEEQQQVYQEKHADFDTQKEEELRLLRAQIDDLGARWVSLKQECQVDYQEALLRAEEAGNTVSELYEAARKEWEEKIEAVEEMEIMVKNERMAMMREVEILQKHKLKIKRLEGDSVCPTCEQRISKAHVERSLDVLDKEIKEKNKLIEEINPRLREADNAVRQMKLDRDAVLLQARDIWLKARDATIEIKNEINVTNEKLRALDQLEKDREHVKESYNAANQKTSPFLSLIESCERQQADAKRLMSRIVPRLKALQIERKQLQFWVSGFSNQGLKSFVLESVVPFMNKKVEEYSEILTDGELEIRFHTQTILKSGESREKFYVEVLNRTGAEDYAGSSGGERRRADLAISFTLSDLVSARSKKAFPQRFFDEPFENLDESGVESVMQLLQGMVSRSGSIFVVTHQDHLKSLFNKVITVEKINGVTRIS